ncbi:hypothetical protein IE077_004003 [Cardiosporidium cionae]|uniref:t-SNARE coiled-coil homology domain-containing protein n=1 Tax=Cardiosporidium cionae TaxID=476202 RepID=A0ABQ7JE78_9APIC|nr:hypothetical protein IE077_004003 [Cardiosporidium cionae]|eukprot:KAF8822317.1 hypothetical protein IE077_004003 [Cardiosporidium cionae]
MSFSLLSDDSRTARERLHYSECRTGDQSDILYINESRKIQEKIFSIQSQTSAISQLCYGITSTSSNSQQAELHKMIDSVKKIALETQQDLKEFAPSDEKTDETQRSLMHKKLTMNFQQALKAVDRVTQNFLQTSPSLKPKKENHTPMTTPSTWRNSMETPSDVDGKSLFVRSSQPLLPLPSNEATLREPFLADYKEEIPSSAASLQQTEQASMAYSFESAELERKLIEERYAGVSQIQKDIVGLHDMYQELAWHVNSQGDNIENIEVRLNEAVSATDNAVREVAQARRTRRSYSRFL